MAVAMEAAPVEAAVETAEDVASDALRLQTFYWTLYIGILQKRRTADLNLVHFILKYF